jgi:DNA-binding transcriptional MerR regulator
LTVRTLHHYDEIGLLKPSQHSESGHRLYSQSDLARLQQIVSLRQLGFSLEQIRDCLEREDFSPVEVLQMHLKRIQEQMEIQRQLCLGIQGLLSHFESAGTVSADEFLHTIGMMNMIENYYTPEQMEYLKKRREEVGEEVIQRTPNDWAELNEAFRLEMEAGTDPSDPKLLPLLQRRQALIDLFTGGNEGVLASVTRLWQEKGTEMAGPFGYDTKVMEYMAKAFEAQSGK